MLAIYKEHGNRWLILIFLLIMFGALTISVKFLVEDTHDLLRKVDKLQESQKSFQVSINAINKKIVGLEKQVVEQDKLITELEKVVNYSLDK